MTSTGAMKMHPKANELRFATKKDGYVNVHPSSVNYTVRRTKNQCKLKNNKEELMGSPLQVRHYDSPYLVYHEKVKTSRVFIRDCSMVSVYPLVLLGGGQMDVELRRGEFVISLDDGWIQFAAASHQVPKQNASLRLGQNDPIIVVKRVEVF